MLQMSDKKSNQLTMPFDLKGQDIKPYVQQHWNITFARQKKVGVLAKKMMAHVMAQIKRDDSDFKPYYQLRVSDIVAPNSIHGQVYSHVRKAFDELTDLKWLIEDLENEKFAYRHLLNTSDAKCGYDKGMITIALNPLLKDYFIELSHYSTYDLKWAMVFESWYSMRLFEILSAFKDKPFWVVSIDEYRKLMDCENKYKRSNSDMLKYTTEAPLIELEPTDVAFTIEEIKDTSRTSKGRKSTIALKFHLKKYKPKANLDDWSSFSEEHSKTLERLTKRYRVSEHNILTYAKIIGMKTIRELLNSWDIKDASANPIQNKMAYCNKTFSDMGKAMDK